MSLRSLLVVASAASLVLPGTAAGMSSELQSVLKNTHRGDEYKYPTDFTRGIMPVSDNELSMVISECHPRPSASAME